MAQIYRPQQQQDPMAKLLPIAGQLGGMAIGGPAGAVGGGFLGSELAPKPQAEAPQLDSSNPAFQRRMQELDNDPLSQIRQGLQAVQQIPDPQKRAELAQPLLQADYIARNKAQG